MAMEGKVVSTTSSGERLERSQPPHDSGMSLASIERLDGNSNYNTWKFMMELYLIHDDLWEYTQTTPDSSDILGLKRDQKARAKICLMVRPHCLVHVRNAKTAKEAWEALRSAFEDKGLNNRCRLLSKMVSLKLEQFSSIRSYVTELMSVAQQLRDIGKEVDDELLAALMLQGLPENFQPMRLAIENSGVELTTDYVKTKLLQMEDSYSSGPSVNTRDTALLTNKHQKVKKFLSKKAYVIKCFICGGPHKARVCPENPRTKKNASVAFGFATSGKYDEWILDSGATNHMTNNRQWLRDYKSYERKIEIGCANGSKVFGIGVGSVICEKENASVSDVMYVPDLATNLLSVSTIIKRGFVVVFSRKGYQVLREDKCKVTGDVVHTGVEENGIYKFKHCSQEIALASTVSEDMALWHRRMGHLGVRNLTLLRDKLATGVSFPNTSTNLECIACLKGKQTKQPFQKGCANRAKDILELVHSDVCGPMDENSISGYKYFLTFIDDFTRKTFVYFLKNKSEVFEKFVEFKAFAEKQSQKSLRILRSDNGKEYVNGQMKKVMKDCGILHQLTVEYTPEQNGVAERANRTIAEKARSMLQEAGLETKFWAEAVNYAVYLKNRSPTIAVKGKTPEEAWTGKKQDLSMVKVFGCKAFAHIPKAKRRKWDPKSKEFIHVGICEESKGYRLIDPATGQLTKARDVVFFESQKFNCVKPAVDNIAKENVIVSLEENVIEDDEQHLQNTHEDFQRDTENREEFEQTLVQECIEEENKAVSDETDEEWMTSDEREEDDDHQEERRYPVRERKKRDFPGFVTYQTTAEVDDPQTVKEALSRSDKEMWRAAIEEELEALKKNNTWKLVEPPQSCNVVDSKWIFRIKEEAGRKNRYKARLVARGFKQRQGIDYFETFSPVVRHSSLRTLMALAVHLNLNVDQMDVKTAFLNGNLDEVVYMKQPEGFEENGKEHFVCLLQRSLYGLKQAPRAWNKRLHNELTKLQFKRSENEPCVYTRFSAGKIIIIAVYVDDILLFWNDAEEMRKVKRDLTQKFEMKDLGKAELMLGIHITQDSEGIKLDQERYIEKILRSFQMEDCKPVATPAVLGQRLERPQPNHVVNEAVPYRALIGSLMYLAVCTRPDIAHTVNQLSQFNNCYGEEHWIAAKRVLRYLKGTSSYSLRYVKGKQQDLVVGYADADHAGDYDRRSNSGWLFLSQGGAISWESKKQRTVALSTAEAEYVSLSEAAKEAVFLRRFIGEMTQQFAEMPSITIFTDSQSAMAIANNPVHHQRTKHVDVRYHFVREAIEVGIVQLRYKETARMVADVLTKALLKGKYEWCVRSMGLL